MGWNPASWVHYIHGGDDRMFYKLTVMWPRAGSVGPFSLSRTTHPTNQFQSMFPPPRYPISLHTQGWKWRSRKMVSLKPSFWRWSKNTKSRCLLFLPAPEEVALLAQPKKKRHWVYKVVTREKFFPPFPLLSFCLLTYYSSCLHSPQS